MNCDRVEELLLEADPALIDAGLEGVGEIGAHLGGCTACMRLAREVLDLNAELVRELANAAPLRPAGDAVDEAVRCAQARGEFRRIRPGRRTLVPLAVAATLAGVLALRAVIPWPQESAGPPVSTRTAEPVPVDVSAPEGMSVAVLSTRDPDIVVYWFYEGGEAR